MSSTIVTGQLVSLIRAQLQFTGTAGSRVGQTRHGRQEKAATKSRPADSDVPPDLSKVVADRVAQIGPTDSDRPRKAFRVFLECVLLAELGRHLINDAAFYDLVDRVNQQMESDEQLLAQIDAAGHHLLGLPTAEGAGGIARSDRTS